MTSTISIDEGKAFIAVHRPDGLTDEQWQQIKRDARERLDRLCVEALQERVAALKVRAEEAMTDPMVTEFKRDLAAAAADLDALERRVLLEEVADTVRSVREVASSGDLDLRAAFVRGD